MMDFDAAAHGTDLATLMARIHGVLPDGTLIEGVEVFRRAYAAAGLGWLVAPTRWPGLRQLSEWAYRVFARNRLRGRFNGDPLEEDPVVQYLPGKYNSESELTLSVPTGSDPISKDFTLVE